MDNLISIQTKKNSENEDKIQKLEAKVQKLCEELEKKIIQKNLKRLKMHKILLRKLNNNSIYKIKFV